MINIFKSNYTQWIPFGNYIFDGIDYIVLARKNLSNGMLYFKTKQAGNTMLSRAYIPADLIDTVRQWDLLTDDFFN